MTSRQATAIIVILIIGFFVLPRFHSEHWEYTVVTVPDESFTRQMDALGSDGWELVSARRASDGSTYSPTFSYEMILKRRTLF
jgi:hypothetical protein